ncbi:nitroreductase family protein [Desulfospira joergensenii]|uniref:nitroreductase family protein n=1 Tax=Desulfospira joergensenii TaxID=53329 RepID=UPI0003B5FF7C|nr:nitroreductase family protein [Desulfospira joergensenii]
MEFKILVETRRSCRAFTDTPVSQEEIEAIVRAGQWAPSPLNQQPFQFIAVTAPEVKAGIRQAGISARQAVADQDGPGWAQKYGMDFLESCPLILVVVSDPAQGGLGAYFNQPHGALQAASACIQNMMLMAEDLGLGSLWFTFFDPEEIKILLDIPGDLEVAGAVLMGTPAGPAKAPPRRTPKVHENRFTP